MNNKAGLREFSKYASLNVLGMIGLSCYILADTFFVARGLGANGLAALNLAIPVYSFINGSGLMLGMGGATKYAVGRAQHQPAKANRAFTSAVAMAGALAVVFCLAGMFFSGGITRVLGADAAVFAMCETYLRVILLFAPAFLLNNVLLCFVRNDGAPQLAMAAMVGGSLSNIVLDYVFIFPLPMEIFGAVLATGLAPLVSMLILSPHFIRGRNGFRLVGLRPSAVRVHGILSGGLPSLITEVSSGIVMIVFNGIILGLLGNTGVAAYGVIANLSLVVISIYTGIAQGIQPILSRAHGAGEGGVVRAVLRYALTTAAVVSALVYAAVFFGAPAIAGAFNGERDPLLQATAEQGLRIYFTACLFVGANIILSVFFTSTERAWPAHVISMMRGFVVILPMALVLSRLCGMVGVWWAFPATEALVAAAAVLLYRRQAGQGRRAARLPAKNR